MSRQYCRQCQRPEKTCICPFTCAVANLVPVIVLQHPSEVDQSKGTLPLLSGSLSHCQVLIGEDFTTNEQLNQLLEQYQDNIYLLYPSDDAIELTSLTASGLCDHVQMEPLENKDKRCIILLDGTWKKAYRIYMLSKNLHNIVHVRLPTDLPARYLIRKTLKKNALSTLEACCYALGLLEDNTEKYKYLLEQFVQFNQFQLSFRPDKGEVAQSPNNE